MNSVKALVLRCAGTNCDEETLWALEEAGAQVEKVHINSFIRGGQKLKDYHMLVVPGGFSYGDDIASGKVLANQLLNHLRESLEPFLQAGKPILGICNGFQVLVKCGLLPGLKNETFQLRSTLTHNDSGKFECRWIYLNANAKKCSFAKGLPEVFPLPVAHGEGKFVTETSALMKSLERNNQVVFRYVNARGQRAGYPWNPNGSFNNVAGICDETGTVLGMMPHPERYAFPHQHSHWTRLKPLRSGSVGLQIFKNAVRRAKKN